jgi:hypothetical protein
LKRKNETNLEIEEDDLFEMNKLGPGMTSTRATAIKYLFIHVFQWVSDFRNQQEDKWVSDSQEVSF